MMSDDFLALFAVFRRRRRYPSIHLLLPKPRRALYHPSFVTFWALDLPNSQEAIFVEVSEIWVQMLYLADFWGS